MTQVYKQKRLITRAIPYGEWSFEPLGRTLLLTVLLHRVLPVSGFVL